MFGGAAWILFHKSPTPYEVYNDYNSLLVNLFRCFRGKPDLLTRALEYRLNSREEFLHIAKLFRTGARMTEIEKAAGFYLLIRHSYASNTKTFNAQPDSVTAGFPVIRAAFRRLERTGVIIENRSFDKLIPRYDDPGSFFYLDPPYFGTEKQYRRSNFSKGSHIILRDILMKAEGKWLLSYNDDPFIRELYNRKNIFIMPVSRLNNIRQKYEAGCVFPELLIANYDLEEQYRERAPEQLMLA